MNAIFIFNVIVCAVRRYFWQTILVLTYLFMSISVLAFKPTSLNVTMPKISYKILVYMLADYIMFMILLFSMSCFCL